MSSLQQFVVGVSLVVLVALVAAVVRRRRPAPAPTQAPYPVPRQLDPADFPTGTPWVVVVFSSSSCQTCRAVVRAAEPLGSSQVGVVEVEYGSRRDLHAKYGIEAVPVVVVADHEGVVRTGIAGPVTATDLWAAVAAARDVDG